MTPRAPRASRTLRLGTRGSALALAQTEIVVREIRRTTSGVDVVIEKISTRGDVVQDRPLSAIGDKGVFVTALEDALRSGRIDAAVHSAKDMPSSLEPDMRVPAYLRRGNPLDVLISGRGDLNDLQSGARVGTSSPRRTAQLRALRDDLDIVSVRGNVDTRLRALDAGEYDALILAAAGLERLGITTRDVHTLSPDMMLPAAGQGAIAIEVAAENTGIAELVRTIGHAETSIVVRAERAFVAATQGGCASAIAAHAVMHDGSVTLTAVVGASDGRVMRDCLCSTADAASDAAQHLAERMLRDGGAELLAYDSTLRE